MSFGDFIMVAMAICCGACLGLVAGFMLRDHLQARIRREWSGPPPFGEGR